MQAISTFPFHLHFHVLDAPALENCIQEMSAYLSNPDVTTLFNHPVIKGLYNDREFAIHLDNDDFSDDICFQVDPVTFDDEPITQEDCFLIDNINGDNTNESNVEKQENRKSGCTIL